MWIGAGLTLLSLLVLLWADHEQALIPRSLAKAAASTGFLATALLAGALESPYGQALLGALVMSWLGDVALIGKSNRSFKVGLFLFLLGHVGFDVAFFVRGVSPVGLAMGLLACLGPGFATFRWLWNKLSEGMRYPVLAYLFVIGSMVTCAVGTTVEKGNPIVLVAAVMFFVSDLLVAREKFVVSAYINRLVGLSLYYVAQLLFASTALAG